MTSLLHVEERTEFKESTLTKLRKEGNIPAVLYGSKLSNKTIYLNTADFQKTIREVGRNGVITLELNGEKYNVILHEYQSDPVKHNLIHLDFLAVDMSTEINAEVRVVLSGDAIGVKDGGVIQQSLHEVSITATPNNIPPEITVDVTNLHVGQNVTIADISGNQPFKINHHDDEVIVSVLPPRQEEEINTGEEQEAGIPENEEGRETKASEE
ncbi:50S ribosomal protein L25/general stress protein Ctc [Bacillaceae bacterium Marseille-Q3522]|nr:50S ribosomal protein L25/general stress protein Ctc [Bacillaceae bacterium Marseille-Q3522]